MVIVITFFSSSREDGAPSQIANVFGPFSGTDGADAEDTARAWADANVDARTVWTTEDVRTPF